MIYEKKKPNYGKVAAIIISAFSLAIFLLVSRPLVKRYLARNDKAPDSVTKGTGSNGSTEESREDMRRMVDGMKKADAASVTGSVAGMDRVVSEMRDYRSSLGK